MQATEKPRVGGQEQAANHRRLFFTLLSLSAANMAYQDPLPSSLHLCLQYSHMKMSLSWPVTHSSPPILNFSTAHTVHPNCLPPPICCLDRGTTHLHCACCTARVHRPRDCLQLLPDTISPHALTTSCVCARGQGT